MKKTLLALSLVSLFGAGTASANQDQIDTNTAGVIINRTSIEGMIKKDTRQDQRINDNKNNIESNKAANDAKNASQDQRIDNATINNANNRVDIGKNKTDINENTANIDENAENINNNSSKIDSSNEKIDDVARRGKAEFDKIYDDANSAAKFVEKAGDDFYKEANNAYAKATSQVNSNTNRISSLENDFKTMVGRQDNFEKRLDKMDKKMDGVMAGTHAVTNARPFAGNGQTAMGVGTGFAGSAQAVAIGVSHNFQDSAWSMSATTNVSTGSGVKTDVSGGVGAHYVF
ncbi:YadA C-terminal domain-containing protein [Photobacterium profundum]|uniref:Trimeric autotransporter adhesin YadA-like C-terminal membrane anchor domain-containing protein n=1 Tax=Photobacterium profundum (strain SS9) TaxID=298386 RepID=Q6LFW7_PHOPR|nr:YadA C-terminal domain-containing protein [Photobacterium profundum]CAG23813.1 hypothetical protein PBPRB1968 [Photobacterium profundum SS9]